MYRFSLMPQITRDLSWLEAAHVRLGRQGVIPRRWAGRLKRDLQARAVAASSRMEGVAVDAEQTRRILADDRPAAVSPRDAALVEGYRDALVYAFAEATAPDFTWSRGLVLDVHRIAMAASEHANAGTFRPGPVYVVNGAGIAIYSTPMAVLVPELVDELCEWLNSSRDLPAPVLSAVVHARMAGIHPFSDGNGRVARILATLAMVLGGYSTPEFTSLEEWWGAHTTSYYGAFASLGAEWEPGADITRFVATHVRAQRRQVAALSELLAVERNVWAALEDIAAEDLCSPPRTTEALFDAFLGRTITNRYYRGVTGVSIATATNDLAGLEASDLLAASGEGRGRTYTGTFRLIALVASAAHAPVLASGSASLAEQRDIVLEDLREQVAGNQSRRPSRAPRQGGRMSARLALVTTDVPWLLEHEFDLAPLLAEFARRGVPVEAVVWHDPSIDWSAFDLIVMRSPWDYSLRTAEFLAWLDSLPAGRVLNPPALIRWNLDKRYLLDLEAHGVSIVPTIVASTLAEVRAAAEKIGGRVVIKPNIGAGSWGAHITHADDPKLPEYAAELFDDGKLVLVEPEIPEITAGGEHGLLFFDGEYSHAITKGRILADDGGYVGGEYAEDISPVAPPAAEIELATRCSRAIAAIAEERGFAGEGADSDAATPLYARYDIVTGADGPLVIEAELFEPSYFVETAPGSVARVVDAMMGRLEHTKG